jgi:hypothetical protein
MKKILIALLTFTAFMVPRELKSQGQDLERIQSYRIALFTRRLNLSPAEAEKFWPVYNEYDSNRTRLQQQRAETIRTVNQNERRMSDDELLKAADKLVALQVEEARVTESLHKKLKEILPPGKVIRVYQAENMFRNQLLNDLRDQREIRKPPLNPGR